MAMRRVLHVWQSGYPWEVRVGKINRALIARGVSVYVLARNRGQECKRERLTTQLRDSDAQAVEDVIRVGGGGLLRPLSLPVPRNPVWLRALHSAVEEIRPDLVIVRDIPLALDAARAAHRSGVPIVLDMAEHYPAAMRSWDKYRRNAIARMLVHRWKLPDGLERAAVPIMEGVLVVCEEQRERLQRDYGIEAWRIDVVMNTPELETWRPLRRRVAAGRRSQAHERIVFGYHGILCEDRGLEDIIRGFDIARRSDTRLALHIYGDGEAARDLRRLAYSLDAAPAIYFSGPYSPGNLGGLYAECDYGIVSLRRNTFTEHTVGNKFFDYAALGLPFVYADVPPLRRLMRTMRCGLAFRSGDIESIAQAFLALPTQDRNELATNGIVAIDRELNWGVDSERLGAFLESVLVS